MSNNMKMAKSFLAAIVLVCLLQPGSNAFASEALLKLPSLFSDNMVLQAGQSDPVWGWAAPGAKIEIEIAGQRKSTVAGPEGTWSLKLDAIKAGGPYSMEVKSEGKTLSIGNILVGEVWLCSGQSNMTLPVDCALNSNEEMDKAKHPQMRFFFVPRKGAAEAQDDCAGCWTVITPESVGGFTAVGYFFARELQTALDGVPVGIIQSEWPGSAAQPWISREAQKAVPELKADAIHCEEAIAKEDLKSVTENRTKAAELNLAKVQEWLAKYDPTDAAISAGWEKPGFDDSSWHEASLPMNFNDEGFFCYAGFVWARKTVNVPADWVGKDLTLNLCAIDDVDISYVNGSPVGRTWYDTPDHWLVPRRYSIPASLMKTQSLTVALRIFNLNGEIGLRGARRDMNISNPASKDEPVMIGGSGWRYQLGPKAPKDVPLPGLPNCAHLDGGRPGQLWNGMIKPLIPYGIKGVLWYQGESNSGQWQLYKALFTTLTSEWRKAWGYDFPFISVQLAGYGCGQKAQTQPIEAKSWAEIRDVQQELARSVPNTALATAIDLGEESNIHPRNKQEVGRRLALLALVKSYGKSVEAYGPSMKSASFNDGKVTIEFDHSDGLSAKAGALNGFAVAGDDKVFHWATASISGAKIVLESKDVPTPVAARYSWANFPVGNLYNGVGLPAFPFKTDNWTDADIKVK